MRIPLPRLGFGGAPLGNMFAPLDETTADATLKAAWDAGIRYYDTSPHYGAGLADALGAYSAKSPVMNSS
jgi:D-threo-aldose 1-dehydrogenase